MSTFERSPTTEQGSRPVYKVYKRRFWGLAQLVLLNIVVSWDVCATSRLIHIPTLHVADSHIQHTVVDLLVHLDNGRGVLRCLRERY
jgi:hypothetical protein